MGYQTGTPGLKVFTIYKRMVILIILIVMIYPIASSQLPAFPEATGFGALSVGGRGGRIIRVTNLNNGGAGSFREALEASGPRIVIFRVGGYIDLTSPVKIYDPYLTIAGQTAPGDGVCLRMKPGNSQGIQGLIYVPGSADSLHDVIIRYLKFRQGWTPTYKGHGTRPHNIYFRRGHEVILDHLSSEWTRDNLITLSLDSESVAGDSMYNFSIQNCLFGESEKGHSTGMNIQGSGPEEDPCAYNGKWVCRFSVHKNLFTGNDHRNPRINTNGVRFINNVTYNWGNRVGSTAHDANVDFINNYFKAGPMTTNNIYYQRLIHEPWVEECFAQPVASIFMSGNVMTPHHINPADPFEFYEMADKEPQDMLEDKYKRYISMQPAPVPVQILTAENAYPDVLDDVGCNARLDGNGDFIINIVTDTVDQRMIQDVLNGTGFDHEIDSADWNPGKISFPEMSSGEPYIDEDDDGMADAWEIKYFGNLTKARYDDMFKTDYDEDGYPDLEEFLNASDPTIPFIISAKISIPALQNITLTSYPNPFITSTNIEYNISKPGYVSLMVYDVTGKKIAGLIRNEFQSAGKHCYVWKAGNGNKTSLQSGVYLVQLTTESFRKTIRVMVM